MIIKVVLLTIVLMFLWFFPSLYTLFYYYRKYGELTDKALYKAWDIFVGTIFIEIVIGIVIGISYGIIYSFS